MSLRQSKSIYLLPFVLLAVFGLSGCVGGLGLGGSSWKEEVLLHDGGKVVVQRSVAYGGRHEIGQRSSYTKQTLSFTHPANGKQVTWQDNASPELGTSSFLPMALDIYRDAVYLVANPMGCLSYNKWGRPNPPYVVFKYAGKSWERIALQELPPETKALNLIFSSPDTEVERLGKRFVDAGMIKQLNTGFSQPEYQTILREAIATPKDRCGEMVRTKNNSWLGIGWFEDQPTREACLNYCVREEVSAEYCPCKNLFKDGE